MAINHNNETSSEEIIKSVKTSNKYQREIKPDVFVDVYDVLDAWSVTDPAIQHAIKKLLQPGARGVKSASQDIDEAIASLERAKELKFYRGNDAKE